MKKIIKVLVVGPKQCGSTRLYNLLRFIYEKKGKNVYGCFNYQESKNDNYDVIISKVHYCDEEYCKKFDFIILPIRNILDSAISSIKRGKKKIYKDACYENIDLFNYFEKKANYIFYYEKYSVYEVKKLCKLLQVNLNNIEIYDIMHKTNELLHIENPDYKKTILTKSHNTSNGKINKFIDEIDKEMYKKLINDNKINTFLEKLNYF